MRILIFILAALCISAKAAAQNSEYYQTVVTFGRYGECSSGRGICGFEATILITPENSLNPKYVISKNSDSSLLLKVFKSDLTAGEEISVLGKAVAEFDKDEKMYFKMDVDLPLNSEAKNTFHISSNFYKIRSGLYLVHNFTNYYLIELKLS